MKKQFLVLLMSWCAAVVAYAQDIKNTPSAYQGINMFSSGDERTVFVNMRGETIYKSPVGLINILPDGNMIGLADTVLLKFDADMNIEWKTPVWGHHDIAVAENGWVYVLSGEVHKFMGNKVLFMDVLGYSPDGKRTFTWRQYEHLNEFLSFVSKSPWLKDLPIPFEKCKSAEEYILQAPERFFIPTGEPGSECVFEFSHFNSLEVIPDNYPYYAQNPAFKKGNLLVSFNPYSAYGIINTKSGKIEWAGYLKERTTLHSVTLTPKGNVLVFENATDKKIWADLPEKKAWLKALPPKTGNYTNMNEKARLWASVSEYNPLTGERVWDYAATSHNEPPIVAKFSGSAQRLPNGNTLICVTTEKEGGRTFEVTPDKKIVWKYISPDKDSETGLPWSYYRAKRISFNVARKMIPDFK